MVKAQRMMAALALLDTDNTVTFDLVYQGCGAQYTIKNVLVREMYDDRVVLAYYGGDVAIVHYTDIISIIFH